MTEHVYKFHIIIMHFFLADLSKTILKEYPGITGDICIVTPNRRAGLFLRKHMASSVKKPLWAPDILSIEEFINRISGFTAIDKLVLLFEFYRIYTDVEKEGAEDVDTFLSWAPALLNDFEDVDAAMADRSKLYDYLTDIRYIDTWNPDGSPLTAFQQQYLSFIKKLQVYHEKLADHVINKKLAWQSLSTRAVAEKFQRGDTGSLQWRKVVFAGFNALTKAEETIISTLLKQGKAEYITDSDPYYVKDTGHEAGRFIRKYSKKFSIQSDHDQKSFFDKMTKKIRIYGVAKNVNQARLAGNLINDRPELTTDENTAVVLANEALLIPVLNAIPPKVNDINVTMGYPIIKTNMYGFFDSLFHLLLQAINEDDKPGLRYYHKDISRFFSNGLCGLLWDVNDGEKQTGRFINSITASNLSFFSFGEMVSLAGQNNDFARAFGFLNGIDKEDSKNVTDLFLDITVKLEDALRKKAALQGNNIVQTSFYVDFESLYYFARMFRKINTLLSEFQSFNSLKTLYRFFKQSSSEMNLSFTGEPLQGLQVMGMLETRCLDFKNIVLLSVNENILPKSKSMQSFIPFEVKKSFGLRIYQEQDAIYAYHFYRLLQRAENIFVIYNTQTEDIGSSEKSRFLTQLQYELPRYNPNTIISEEIISIPAKTGLSGGSIIIEKSDDIMHRLYEMARKGFSPSALGSYINCPLQFYFSKVASIKEADVVEETMEASTIGSVVHSVFEKLYKPYEGKVLNPSITREMLSRLNISLQEAFKENYSGGNLLTGKNYLMFHLIKRYIENILDAERRFLLEIDKNGQVLQLAGLEQLVQGKLVIDNHDKNVPEINIRGKADRIDRLDQVVRISDYKTGRVDRKDLLIGDWSATITDVEKGKAFQLLCYAWMYHKQFPEEAFISAGIISVRNPQKGFQSLLLPDGQEVLVSDQLLEFESYLCELVSMIIDAGIAFSQTNDAKTCTFCNYKTVCNRH